MATCLPAEIVHLCLGCGMVKLGGAAIAAFHRSRLLLEPQFLDYFHGKSWPVGHDRVNAHPVQALHLGLVVDGPDLDDRIALVHRFDKGGGYNCDAPLSRGDLEDNLPTLVKAFWQGSCPMHEQIAQHLDGSDAGGDPWLRLA